ncbi:MAG: cyclic 2,3-diphosphoglycerate synthase [Candidatus Thermoplasmatota archaeon]
MIIIGAAGRDFHNFNVAFRDKKEYKVIAFTASQIPGIADRLYPKKLAGLLYPKGIPIYPETELKNLVEKYDVDEVILAYSDLSYNDVMHKASIALSAGADFRLMGPKSTMLSSKKKTIAVSGVRTGVGKSPVSRKVCSILRSFDKKVVVLRHPMPYGSLEEEVCQRFEKPEDMKKYNCTIEEMEEFGPHIQAGNVVYAGIDYEKILSNAEAEADIIFWDGGNNDLPFIKPDLHIVVADCLRPGHEITWYPGEANLRCADVVIINKVSAARPEDVKTVEENVKSANPRAEIIKANLSLKVDKPELIKEKDVLVVEDGPSITHGMLSSGAGMAVSKLYSARPVNPRKYAVGSIRDVYLEYQHLENVLPAVGYSKAQMNDLENTINAVPADAIVFGTPIDLRNFMKLNKPAVLVKYELEEIGEPNLKTVIKKFLEI